MVRSSTFLPAIQKHSCLTNVFFQILIFSFIFFSALSISTFFSRRLLFFFADAAEQRGVSRSTEQTEERWNPSVEA